MKRNEAERRFMIIYTVLAFVFLVAGVSAPYPALVLLGTIPEMVVCWAIFGVQWKDEKIRATVFTGMCLISLICFGVMTMSMNIVVPLLAVALVLIGLFNIPQLLGLWSAAAVLMFLLHMFVLKTYCVHSLNDYLIVFHQLFCMALLFYLENSLIKRNIENNRQLLDNIEILKGSERSKDEFMASVSHEFRTPLNAICGMGELILRSGVPEEVQKSAESILTSGRNMQAFVSDVFDYVEIESGKMTVQEAEYSFSALLMDIADISNAQIVEKKLDIIIDCDANIPRTMVGDSEKIRKVIMYLMNNAIKFTEKGCVLLAVSVRKESYGVNLCITVRDTGIGMSKEDIRKVFTDFSRIDAEADSQYGGVGLGLTLTRRLVEMMRGLVSVKSELGVGSEFKIVIPQKVTDSSPIAEIPDKEHVKAIGYINIEKYSVPELRSLYVKWITDTEKRLGISIQLSTNFSELKRRMESQTFSHLFTVIDEYRQEPAFFEEMSMKMPVIVVMGREDEEQPGDRIIVVYKPFTILSVVNALAGHSQRIRKGTSIGAFGAPEAKVLVVDDTVVNLKVMEGLLKQYRITPYTAASGAAALSMAGNIRFDLIILDYMMPGMDGVAVLKALRAMNDEHYKKVPVVCLTANAVTGAKEQLLAAGFDEFMAKPVEVGKLEQVLRSYLPGELLKPVEELEKVQTEAGRKEKQGSERPSKIDRVMGENYCCGQDNYHEILKVFCEYGAEKRRELQKLYERKDWSGYAIEIHALKSTSLGIGAVGLSEQAKILELAAKEENEAVLFEKHDAMMKEYRYVLTEIADSLENN